MFVWALAWLPRRLCGVRGWPKVVSGPLLFLFGGITTRLPVGDWWLILQFAMVEGPLTGRDELIRNLSSASGGRDGGSGNRGVEEGNGCGGGW